MSHRTKIIKEWVEVLITTAGTTVKETFNVDKQVDKIVGIALTSDYDDRLYFRGSLKVLINEVEIYPEGFESKMLQQGLGVPAKDRMIPLDEEMEPGNRKVEIDYKDTNHPSAPFTQYRVRLYVFSKIAE